MYEDFHDYIRAKLKFVSLLGFLDLSEDDLDFIRGAFHYFSRLEFRFDGKYNYSLIDDIERTSNLINSKLYVSINPRKPEIEDIINLEISKNKIFEYLLKHTSESDYKNILEISRVFDRLINIPCEVH